MDRNSTGVISGVPEVVHGGRGGLGDVVLHPRYDTNQLVYISYVERGDGGRGGVVARARLALDERGDGASEAERFDMRRRIREVEQGPDGAIWLLEDGTRQGKGWLLKLMPRHTG